MEVRGVAENEPSNIKYSGLVRLKPELALYSIILDP